ncbi:hypothetical protein Droror1_Dr00018853 [Drosera rotundifolia]
MFIDDELLEIECRLSDPREDETYLFSDTSWQFLFPEVAAENSPRATETNCTPPVNEEGTANETTSNGSDSHAASNLVIDSNKDESRDATAIRLESVDSLSSTSSESSSDKDLIELDTSSSLYCSSRSDSPRAVAPRAETKDNEVALDASRTGETENADSGHAIETRVSDAAHESVASTISQMHSPPLQVMERDGHCDPQRIPSSVFDRKDSGKPADWSITSTESLFSIHVGKPSYGADFPFSPTAELDRYDELVKSDELLLHSPSDLSTRVDTFVVEKTANEGKNLEEKPTTGKAIAVHTTHSDMGKVYPLDPVEEKSTPKDTVIRSSDVSRCSNDSAESAASFAFPILTPAAAAHNVEAKWDHPEPQLESRNSTVFSKASTAKRSRGCTSCFSCIPCFSCRCSCCSFTPCFSCSRCCCCFSCSSCRPCCCC